jgi:cytochrome c biogenesis protein CcmG, thiol:disulfide interchange protein DsbE
VSTAEPRARLAGRGVIAVLAALFVLNAAWAARHCEALRPISMGDLAPSVSLPLVDGSGERSLAQLKGKVVLVDFWATWCGPCELTLPMQKRLYEKYAAQGFDVWSVNEDQGKDADARARAYAQAKGLPFPVVHDHDGLAAELFKVESFPHMVIVDRLGVVRKVNVGVISLSKLEEDLDAAIRAGLTP